MKFCRPHFTISLDFELGSFLTFLVCVRKLCFWIVIPTGKEFETMDFFVRHLNNTYPDVFPKITHVEEDIKSVLANDMEEEEKIRLKYFLLNHFQLLQFQAALYKLTIKKSDKNSHKNK